MVDPSTGALSGVTVIAIEQAAMTTRSA